MEDGKQLESPRDHEFVATLDNSSDNSENHSQYYGNYCQFFRSFDAQAYSEWNDHNYTKAAFAQNGIIYHPECFKEPSYDLSPSPHHKRVYIANVKLGFFQLSLQILQASQKSSINRVKRQGKFGKIAMITFLTDKLAIKSIQILSKSDKMKILSCTIKQYCFYRIASILKCGPKTINYFGFDLIVFEDCIQFAMEKIKYTVNMSVILKKHLQQCLFLLHRFHIIHFDIKPTNLGYSTMHRKYVFLDFGLSEIIEQSVGTKKLLGFRGSIACCSQQMLHIFYDYENKHYIDAYYNDIVCLQNTLDIISANSVDDSKLSILGSDQRGKQTNDGTQQDLQDNQQTAYLIIFAKYLLCSRKYKEFQEFIKKYLVNEANMLLNFIEEMNSNPQLQAFFIVGLKELQNMDQYVRIEKRLSNKNRLWSSNKIRSSQEETQQQQTLFINEQLTNISLQIDEEACYSSKEVIYEILTNPTLSSIPKQLYFTFYIRALRFDSNISCISFSTKSHYAKIFIKYILKTQPLGSDLNQIRQTIYYLMEYSLEESSINWSKNNIYQILTQFIILDCNFEQLHNRFPQRVRDLYISFQQLIDQLVNVEKVQKLLLLKHRTKYPTSHQLLSQTLDNLFFRLFANILSFEDKNNSKVVKIIHKLVSYSLQNKNNKDNFEDFSSQFQQIQNLSLRRNLQKFAYSNQLYSRISYADVNYCFEYLQKMNPYFTQSIFMNSHQFLNIDLGLYELIIIMKAINNTSQLKRIGSLMLGCFGHLEIYQNFKIQMLIFLSKQSIDEEKYILYGKQIASSPFQISHESISAQFLEIWKKIVHIDSIATKQGGLIDTLINKINTFLRSDMRADNFSITNTINESHIFQLAIKFSTNKQQYINHILTRLEQGFMKTNNKLIIQNYRIKYLIYSSNLNLTILKVEQSYQAYKALLDFANQHESVVLYSFCYKNLFMTANYLGLEQEKMYYLRVYSHLSLTLCEYKGYFLNQERQLIFETLKTLARISSSQQIYHFLDGISAFITHYPIQHYFIFWIKSIILFQKYFPQYFNYEQLNKYFSHKLDWQNAYIVCYYSICLISQRNLSIQKKILLKIANGLRRIDFFAKNHILNIYYQKILKIVSHQRRKKMVILSRQSKKQLICHLQKKFRGQIKTKICKNDNIYSRQKSNLLKFCKIIKLF